MLKKIEELVQGQGHCVLGTCGPGGPHTSLMSFAAAPGLGEFWLATRTDTLKYRNLAAAPQASLLIDDRLGQASGSGQGLALTVTCRSLPFADAALADAARQTLATRHPGLSGFLAHPQVRMLRLVALRFQLLDGLEEALVLDAEKMLDASGAKA